MKFCVDHVTLKLKYGNSRNSYYLIAFYGKELFKLGSFEEDSQSCLHLFFIGKFLFSYNKEFSVNFQNSAVIPKI